MFSKYDIMVVIFVCLTACFLAYSCSNASVERAKYEATSNKTKNLNFGISK